MQLADDSDGNSNLKIDMLVGSDFYLELVTGRVIKGVCGPVAIQPKLGWVLCGPAQLEGSIQCVTNVVTTHVLKIEPQPMSNDDLESQL